MRQLTRRQRISAAVLTILALCFITLDLGGGSLRNAHDGVGGTFGSLYRGTDAVLGPLRRWAAGLPDAGTNESRIKALQHDNAVLRGRIDALSSDRSTSTQLARLQHEISIPVIVADRPLDSVVLGTATVVEHFEQLQKVVVDGHRR